MNQLSAQIGIAEGAFGPWPLVWFRELQTQRHFHGEGTEVWFTKVLGVC